MPLTNDPQGTTAASIFIWIAAGVVVVLGMARLPLIPDRVWRFFCWSAAIVLGLYAAARIHVIPTGWIWVTWAVLAIAVLGLLFYIERLLEHDVTETVKESSSAALPRPTATPVPWVPTAPSPSSRDPIFDTAPPGLADLSPASLEELFVGRTAAQAGKLAEQHIGKRVSVTGAVENVTLGRVPHVHLRSKGVAVLTFFDDDDYDAEPFLLSLNVGDEVTVSGLIWKLENILVNLDHCRVLNARGPSS
jgi:hypothetical protein